MKILSLLSGFYGKAVLGMLVLALPFIILTIAGLVYLTDSDLLLWWLGCLVVCYFIGTRLWVRASSTETLGTLAEGEDVVPEPFWNSEDLIVWQMVRERAAEIERGDSAMSSLAEIKADLERLAKAIASAYYPRSNQPLLEVRAAHFLIAIEQVSRDLRKEFLEQVPFHEVLTVNELIKAKRSFDLIQMLYNGYRLVRPMVNPVSALVEELRGLITRRAFDKISTNSSRWMKARLIECFGKHLINLYSGQVRSEGDLKAALCSKSGISLVADPEEQPLRVLILGEVNAGKSSLINALAGRMRSTSHYLPETKGALVVDVEVKGIGPVHLIDTRGYNFDNLIDQNIDKLQGIVKTSDAVIVVSPATNAARSLDLKMVSALKLIGVPILIGVTKIDLLRPPLVWNPPYNLMNTAFHSDESDKQKACNIRNCIEHIADEFSLPLEHVVPLCVADPETSYNMDSLICALDDLLPEARRRLLRRILVDYRSEQGYEEFKRSVIQSGRLVLRAGLDLLLK